MDTVQQFKDAIEECNYIVHDLIRNFSPYSWMIIGALIIMMFVATLLI